MSLSIEESIITNRITICIFIGIENVLDAKQNDLKMERPIEIPFIHQKWFKNGIENVPN